MLFQTEVGSLRARGFEPPASLTIQLSDAPVDEASHLYVSIAGISLNYNREGWFDYNLPEAQRVDMLTLQGGSTLTLLDKLPVLPGDYQVRLRLYDDGNPMTYDNAIVMKDTGAEYELSLPEDAESGLTLETSMLVLHSTSPVYTIDFDLRRSIVHNEDDEQYDLIPSLTLIDNSRARSLAGTIDDTTLLESGCSDADPLSHNAVYLFSGLNVTPDDIDSTDAEPVATARVNFDASSGIYSYELPFVHYGDYTLSFTCNADLENIADNDDLSFKETRNIILQSTAENKARFLGGCPSMTLPLQ